MIIGVAGSFGSGKGTVVEYLQTLGFKHYSASTFITEEVERRGLPLDRDSMTVVANELRKEHGPSYIIETLCKRAHDEGGNSVIESLRATAEVQLIKELGGKVVGVDADPYIRYERAHTRGSEKDHVSYEKFLAQEKAETNPDDPTKQNIFGALEDSDIRIENNGTLSELHAQIDSVLKEITK
jgi:dephospho-CoA kinase